MDKRDLQSVLAALRDYTPTPPHGLEPSQATAEQSMRHTQAGNISAPNVTFSSSLIPGLGMLPAPPPPPPPVTVTKPVTPPPVSRKPISSSQQSLSAPHPAVSRSRTSTPSQDIPDASTIVTWPAALKHVTRHLLPNEQIASRIKHLISEQHKHERQWHAGREMIVARHEGRDDASQQVSALLRSLGGKATPAPPSDPKAMEAELKVFDEKVYKGLLAMAADFDRQLRAMGVPFYAIRHDLVVLEEGRQKDGGFKGRIDKGELRELQHKMLQTLEDLFSD